MKNPVGISSTLNSITKCQLEPLFVAVMFFKQPVSLAGNLGAIGDDEEVDEGHEVESGSDDEDATVNLITNYIRK